MAMIMTVRDHDGDDNNNDDCDNDDERNRWLPDNDDDGCD